MNRKETSHVYKLIENNKINELKLLIEEKEYNFNLEEARDVINYTISKNNRNMLEMLLSIDFLYSKINKNGMTLLQSACSLNKLEIVKYLFALSIDLDINNINKNQKTALSYAITSKNKQLVELLLKKGANANTLESDEKSMLQLAIEHESLEIVSLLIDFGADINYINKNGMSVFHTVCIKGNKDIFWLFLEKGAKNTANHLNYTPFDYAKMNGFSELLQLHELFLAQKEKEKIIKVLNEEIEDKTKGRTKI